MQFGLKNVRVKLSGTGGAHENVVDKSISIGVAYIV